MKLKLLPFQLLGLYLVLTSATYINLSDSTLATQQNSLTTTVSKAGPARTHRLNFFQRLELKLLLKKQKFMDELKANKLAHTSLILGIVAPGAIIIGLFVPFIIFLCVPAGIAAMITGGAALRQKTTLVGNARIGKALGLGALITLGVLLIIGSLLIASFGV